jgi:hypothetical protein
VSDPRYPDGEPRPYGKVPPRAEFWRPVEVFHVELACPDCRRGRLVASGEATEQGHVHACDNGRCLIKFVVPGAPYPRRIERVDTNAQPLRGDTYA